MGVDKDPCCNMDGAMQKKAMRVATVRAFTDEGKSRMVHSILLDPKVWIAIFDVVGLLLFTQFEVDFEPEVFW